MSLGVLKDLITIHIGVAFANNSKVIYDTIFSNEAHSVDLGKIFERNGIDVIMLDLRFNELRFDI